jgi:hypothetical protein
VYGPAVSSGLSFKGDTDFASKTLYQLDPWVQDNHQHTHPYFMAMDLDRNYYGLMLESDRPMAVEVQPGVNGTRRKEPMVIFRYKILIISSNIKPTLL